MGAVGWAEQYVMLATEWQEVIQPLSWENEDDKE